MPHHPDGEDYARTAADALAGGDLVQAMNLVAAALTFCPTRPDWLELVDVIAQRADDPLKLVQGEEPAFFGLVAIRGLLLARLRRPAEALALHLEVASFRPDVPYLQWVNSYLESAVFTKDDLGLIGPKLSDFVRAVPPRLTKEAPERSNTEAALAIVRTLRKTFTEHGQLAFFEGLLLRRLGSLKEAVQVTVRDLQELPSWFTAVGAAASHRALGEVEAALRCYRVALQFEPTDVSTHIDVGDLLLEEERYSEALNAYETALEIDPKQVWAQASRLFAQYHLTDDVSLLAQLQALASQGNDRALELLQR